MATLAVDANDDIVATGRFSGTSSFGGTALVSNGLGSLAHVATGIVARTAVPGYRRSTSSVPSSSAKRSFIPARPTPEALPERKRVRT